MSIKYVNNYGKVTIDDSVIANIACASVMSSYGVVGLASRSTKDGIYKLLGIHNMDRGVQIERNIDGSVNVNISLILEYGVRIAVVCENIIDNVKYNIEKSLNIGVSEVNIVVQGIRK
ncbi:MAG: Asp23/Gls24 family envelope stress response protein [Anaerococcus sp.]|nr:Asp23/Gls24 family envelope stress response protein [Peptoniphilaceae bacterium]MDY3055814.1 Asp23/Gls24 family envelope stress response protein [Anaerococcus sp.]